MSTDKLLLDLYIIQTNHYLALHSTGTQNHKLPQCDLWYFYAIWTASSEMRSRLANHALGECAFKADKKEKVLKPVFLCVVWMQNRYNERKVCASRVSTTAKWPSFGRRKRQQRTFSYKLMRIMVCVSWDEKCVQYKRYDDDEM